MRDVIVQNSDRPAKKLGFGQSRNNDAWHVKLDASCGRAGKGDGLEVASYVARTLTDARHIAHVADCLRLAGVEVTENCGLHIHCGAEDFDCERIGVLIGAWLSVEGTLTHAVPMHRRHSTFCDLLRHRHGVRPTWQPKELWYAYMPGSVRLNENPDKHWALNLVNYLAYYLKTGWNRCTVELRLPEGTLAGTEVLNWTRLFVNFVEHTRNTPYDQTVRTYAPNLEAALVDLGLHHDHNFYILDGDLFETKTWFLKRLLRYSDSKYIRQQAASVLNRMWSPERNFRSTKLR